MSNQKRFALIGRGYGSSTFDEYVQDVIGGILVDSSEINFTYTDATPSITAALINASITFARLQNFDALSVLGRSANSSGVSDEIAAAVDGDILNRNGTTLGFGQTLTGAYTFSGAPHLFTSAAAARIIVGHTASIVVGSTTNPLQIHTAAGAGVTATRFTANSTGPQFVQGKSRGAAVGTFTAVQSGDQMGLFQFAGADGTDLSSVGASLRALVDGTVSTGVVPGRMEIHTATAAGALTLAMRVNAAQQSLGVDGSAAAPTWSHINDSDSGEYSAGTNILGWATAGVERFTLQSTLAKFSVSLFELESTNPQILLDETNADADERQWRIRTDAGLFELATYSDAGAAGSSAVLINRTGTTVSEIELNATLFDFNGNLDLDGTTHTLDGTTITATGGSAVVTLAGTEVDLTATTLDFNGAVDISGTLVTGSTIVAGGSITATNLILSFTAPAFAIRENDATADEGNWDMFASADVFNMRAVNDALSAASTWLRVLRTGTTVDEIEGNATTFDFNGTLDVDGAAHDISTSSTFTISGTGETLATFVDDGAVTLYHNNVSRIATSATGVDMVAGTFRLFGYTVAALPAGTIGQLAYVTDALAPVFGAAVAGGGAVMVPVYYTGAAWFVG